MSEFIIGFLAGFFLCLIFSALIIYFGLKFLRSEIGLQRGEDLSQSSDKLITTSQNVISQTLDPLKERIIEYHKLIETFYSQEAKERFALSKEVQQLMQVNSTMEEETKNLIKALKGDVKLQGNWGEMILERLLEGSGLKKDSEYTVQAQGMGLKGDDGQVLRPDVIINLPENHHVVIDSKVTLKAYAQYIEDEDLVKREVLLKDLKKSFQQHIDGLSSKSYHSLDGLSSPDFVFMFVPIEGAYILALQAYPELTEYAWKKNIVLATSTTLMASLKTIASIWRVEKQSKNAQEIARKGGLIYDKIVNFCEDFEKLGETISKSQKMYDDTAKKLFLGKGNIVNRAEELRDLGANSTKSFQ